MAKPVPVTPNIYIIVSPESRYAGVVVWSTYANHDGVGEKGLERKRHGCIGAAKADSQLYGACEVVE
jgi:hypothetical protein